MTFDAIRKRSAPEAFKYLCRSLEVWDNAACVGYVLHALERSGHKPEEIQAIVGQLTYAFDELTIDEAAAKYNGSPY